MQMDGGNSIELATSYGSYPEIIIYPYALYSFINLGFAIKI